MFRKLECGRTIAPLEVPITGSGPASPTMPNEPVGIRPPFAYMPANDPARPPPEPPNPPIPPFLNIPANAPNSPPGPPSPDFDIPNIPASGPSPKSAACNAMRRREPARSSRTSLRLALPSNKRSIASTDMSPNVWKASWTEASASRSRIVAPIRFSISLVCSGVAAASVALSRIISRCTGSDVRRIACSSSSAEIRSSTACL